VCCSVCWLAGLSAWWLKLDYLYKFTKAQTVDCSPVFLRVFATRFRITAPANLATFRLMAKHGLVVLRWRRTLGIYYRDYWTAPEGVNRD
jgi:hypothetical protein